MAKEANTRRKIEQKRTSRYLSLMKERSFILILLFSVVFWFAFFVGLSKAKLGAFHADLLVEKLINKVINKGASCFTCSTNILYDPYLLSQKIRQRDTSIEIVDIRSKDEFIEGHIRTAINIPVYTSLSNIEKTEREKADIVSDFSKLTGKKIVIYGSSSYSSLPSVVKDLLDKYHIPVTVLAIGWNEWYDFRNIWVPEGEWNNFDPDNYSVLGR